MVLVLLAHKYVSSCIRLRYEIEATRILDDDNNHRQRHGKPECANRLLLRHRARRNKTTYTSIGPARGHKKGFKDLETWRRLFRQVALMQGQQPRSLVDRATVIAILWGRGYIRRLAMCLLILEPSIYRARNVMAWCTARNLLVYLCYCEDGELYNAPRVVTGYIHSLKSEVGESVAQ
ncbi:hypothetical protein BDV96DRAFT_287380 [Lophiotrema nucula]|uniref:Uncharacterized protein n=1 Tax=Lophiotrema nucula TaxID=690887 RepID=A0A6A5YPK5_9PLEO|nr:hypothetical protein BDV96DRAFT_287380 [Lophiotrema nucula]